MRILMIAGLALIATASIANAETRDARGFTSVSAADPLRVEVIQGATYVVEVTGGDADKIITRVEDGQLRIYRRNRPWWGNHRLDAQVRVQLPAVDGISAARGAEVRAAEINADEMSLSAAMGGEITASGRCRALNASAAMGAAINAQGLQCGTADISASMGAEVSVYASQSYDVAASMGADVNIGGGGEGRDVALSMGASVDRE